MDMLSVLTCISRENKKKETLYQCQFAHLIFFILSHGKYTKKYRNIHIFWINIWYIDKIIVFLPQKKAKMLKGSRFYTKALDATSIPTIEGETKIIVENDDSIHCGHQLQQEGYNPMVLNLASRRNPGGGVRI